MGIRNGLRSITGKLLAAFFVVFLPLIGVTYLCCWEHCEAWSNLARRSRASAARGAAATVDRVVHLTIGQLHACQSEIEHGAGATPSTDLLQSLIQRIPHCVALGFLEGDGQNVYRYPPVASGEREPDLPSRGRSAISSVSAVRQLGGETVFTVSVPVNTAEGKPAVIYAVLTSDAVATALDTSEESYCTMVLDQQGKVVCRTGPPIDGRHCSHLVSAVQLGLGEVAEVGGIIGVPGSLTTTELAGWRVVATNPGTLRPPALAGMRLGLLTFVATLVALLLAFHLGSRITSPIRRLSRAAAAVAVGDLRRRVHVATGDELQSLAENFNRMAASLEAHEASLQFNTSVQQCLLDVTRTITASLDLEDVAAAIEDALKQRFGASEVYIFRAGETGGEIEPVRSRGRDSGGVPAAMLNLAKHALGAPEAPSAPAVAYPDARSTDDAVVAVPLVVGNRRIGVLAATFPAEAGTSDALQDRMGILETFAACAAVALRNADIHSRTEEFNRALASLRQVVESISSSLDLKQVLRSLVKTTCDVTGATACAILFADRGGVLSVAESHNLSRPFRAALNIQAGERWTGVAFAEKRPIARTDVAAETDLRLRAMAEKEGLHGFMCAPLVVGDECIGTINIWMSVPHEAKPTEVQLLVSIANHAAAVIANARLFSREYRIAETLQNTLMGSMPDRIGRLEFGHKYMPAMGDAEVGGDLCDVATLPSGKVALVVADVSGKGIEAAVHTAAIRYMARAYGFLFPDSPAAALALLNKAMANYLGTKLLVTAFYAVIDPETGQMTYANAGHPPAIVLTHAARQQILLYRTGMPLGYSNDCSYDDRTLHLVPGDTLLLYTDGIVEARREGRVLSIEGLQDILFENSGLGPRELVETICEKAISFSKGDLRDDVAVLAASITGTGSGL